LAPCPASLSTFAGAFGSVDGVAGTYNAQVDYDPPGIDVDGMDLMTFANGYNPTCP
jgi:hypothetical protein